MSTERTDRRALEQIVDSIEAIQRHPAPDPDSLEENELLGSHCVRHLIIIGEAVSRLSESFRRQHDHVAWHEIVGMRNILVLDYEEINWREVFHTVEEDLPALKARANQLRESFD